MEFNNIPVAPNTEITWETLKSAAAEVLFNSYSPYSNFRVGAAGLLEDGRIVTGTNVENASYGMTLCAECSMLSANVSAGRSLFVAIVILGLGKDPLESATVEPNSGDDVPFIIGPCGRCRQILAECSSDFTVILSSDGPKRLIGDILPYYREF